MFVILFLLYTLWDFLAKLINEYEDTWYRYFLKVFNLRIIGILTGKILDPLK